MTVFIPTAAKAVACFMSIFMSAIVYQDPTIFKNHGSSMMEPSCSRMEIKYTTDYICVAICVWI